MANRMNNCTSSIVNYRIKVSCKLDGRKTERISSTKLRKEENAKSKPELKEKKPHRNYNTTDPQNKQKTNPTKFIYVPHHALNGVVLIYTLEA